MRLYRTCHRATQVEVDSQQPLPRIIINIINSNIFLKSHDAVDLAVLSIPLVQLIWSYLDIFVYCNFGESVTDEFIEIYNGVCQLDWYLIPMEFRKCLPYIMLITHEPVILHGFGQFLCTREAFKNVSRIIIK